MAADSIISRAVRACRTSVGTIPGEPGEGGIRRVAGTYRFGADFAGFAGHFPGNPVVPGVCLLEAARQLAAEAVGGTLVLTVVRQVKFYRPLAPGDGIAMELTCKPGGAAGEFAVTGQAVSESGGATVAKFQLEGRSA